MRIAHPKRLRTITLVCAMLQLNACSSKADTTTPTQIDPIAQLASCGTRTELFTVSPIAFSDFLGWVPLGNLGPPLHTFPSPHQYLFHTLAGGTLHTVPVVSPGAITLTRVGRRVYTADGRADYKWSSPHAVKSLDTSTTSPA